MLSSSGSEKVPGDPGASIIMAVGEALIQSSGIGTDALVGQERAILGIIGFDGALERRMGGGGGKGLFPQQAWRYPKTEADLEIEVSTNTDSGRALVSPLFGFGP